MARRLTFVTFLTVTIFASLGFFRIDKTIINFLSPDKARMADNMLKRRKYESAKRWANRILAEGEMREKDTWRALLVLSMCALIEGRDAEAEKHLKKVLEVSKNDYKAFFFLGIVKARAGDYEKANGFFAASAKYYNIDPSNHSPGNEDLEYSKIAYFEMMSALAAGKDAEWRNRCDYLLDRKQTPATIRSWCELLQNGVLTTKTEKTAKGGIGVRTHWKDAVAAYFPIPQVTHDFSVPELLSLWQTNLKLARPDRGCGPQARDRGGI